MIKIIKINADKSKNRRMQIAAGIIKQLIEKKLFLFLPRNFACNASRSNILMEHFAFMATGCKAGCLKM